MKSEELTVRVPFIRVRRGLNVTFQQAGGAGAPGGPPTPLARCLAKAHVLAQALSESGPGALARLAKQEGVSRQRLAQVHTLTYLAPDLQEAVLMGTLEASKVHFPALLKMAQMPLWQEQRKFWKQIVASVAASKPEKEPGQQGTNGNMKRSFTPQKSLRSGECQLVSPNNRVRSKS